MNGNTTQRLPQNIARIIKKIKKIQRIKKIRNTNETPPPILLAGWSVGWLARWLVAVSKGILKESYTNPYEIQPASHASQPGGCGEILYESLRNPMRFV